MAITAEKVKHCRDVDPGGLVFATSDFSTLPWFLPSLLISFGSYEGYVIWRRRHQPH